MYGSTGVAELILRPGQSKIISSGKGAVEALAEGIPQRRVHTPTRRITAPDRKETENGVVRPGGPYLGARVKHQISEIADVQMGYQFRGKVEPEMNGTHRVVQIRDFDENLNLNIEGLWLVIPKSDARRYAVYRDDVLFLSRGHRNFATVVKGHIENAIAASYFFILRTKTKHVLPEYLAWYINQRPAQEYFHNIARRGTHMPLVPLSAFADLVVEVPDLSTQATISELDKLARQERALLDHLQERRSQLVTAACLRIAKKKEMAG